MICVICNTNHREPQDHPFTECKLCAEGMPLKKYLDGTMRHFDGLMAWHPCSLLESEDADNDPQNDSYAETDKPMSGR